MSEKTANPSCQFELSESLDLCAAAPLAANLLALRGADVVLDASAVHRLGGQCLQVLLSAKATWESDGAALHVVNPSSDFVEGLRLLGIQPEQLLEEGST